MSSIQARLPDTVIRFEFPDAFTIKTKILSLPTLWRREYQKTGIIWVIAELAAQRFAHATLTECEASIRIAIIVDFFSMEPTRFQRKPPLNLFLLKLEQSDITKISMVLTEALLGCAKKEPPPKTPFWHVVPDFFK